MYLSSMVIINHILAIYREYVLDSLICCRISDASGKMEFELVKDGEISRDVLDSKVRKSDINI